MTETNREALLGTLATNLPDNTTGEISPADIRNELVSLADSVPFRYTSQAIPPITTDDISGTAGNGSFGIGDLWVDSASDIIYICADNTATAAVWQIAATNFPVISDGNAVGNQIAIWQDNSAVSGTSNFTYVGGVLTVTGTVAATDFTGDGSALTGFATVATSGEYTDLASLPVFGTAATTDATSYATSAQGTTADNALQNADIGLSVQGYASVLANTTASFTASKETKLTGIEIAATADQTAGEIEAIIDHDNLIGFVAAEHIDWALTNAADIHPDNYTDTNTTYSVGDGGLTEVNFTTADNTKLDNIEALADVTDTTNVAAAGAVMNSDITTETMAFVIDEDTLVSNSATKVPTQQSVKSYVDAAIASSVTYQGGYNATTNTPNLDTSPTGISVGNMYTVTVAGTFFSTALEIGDVLIAEQDDPTIETHWTVVNKDLDASSIKVSYESNSDTNAFTDAAQTKLTGIETAATADQTAGEIEAIVNHDNLIGFVAAEHIDWALTNAADIHPGNYTDTNTTYVSGDFDHNALTNYVAAEHIDWSATNAADIHPDNYTDTNTTYVSGDFDHNALTNYVAAEHIDWALTNAADIHPDNYTDTNTTYSIGDGGLTEINFTTAKDTKLSGIEALADVTDTTNVVAALTAGTNITISAGGTIAASGGTALNLYAENPSSYTSPSATGTNAVAIGSDATASGYGSFATGQDSTASGSRSVAIGYNALSLGSTSYALSAYGRADQDYGATLFGARARSLVQGKAAYGPAYLTALGQVQGGMLVCTALTTNATPATLTTTNSSASTTNQVILPNESAYSFSGTIIARQQTADGSNYASWEVKGALLRDANAASTVLGNGIVNQLFATAGAAAWDIALTADTTNGGLKIEATGAATTNIKWVATINTTEVTYA